ncbi:MAG: class I SAM-dependent methyltransferase [Gemmatimonadales bacterium]
MTDGSKEFFDGVADAWDEMRKNFYSDAVRDRALDVADVKPGRLAADIGAGTGFMTEGLLARGLNVVAVDQSQRMLEQMKQKFSAAGSVEYKLGGDSDLGIGDESVDYVFANMYLHHVEDPPAAIRAMARTLRPGGLLVITDVDKHDFEFLREEHNDRWLGFPRDSVDRWFRDTGLRDVVVDDVGQNCCVESSCGEAAAIGIFVASGTK